jgi:hypothetical protein
MGLEYAAVKHFAWEKFMATHTSVSPKFFRRTGLAPNEYRKNFRQIDQDAIEAVTSAEACKVTPLMSKIYLRLINAPSACWESKGVLRFTGDEREGKWTTGWEQLLAIVGVASATASKAMRWLHASGVIGYDAHRNGVGIRIFINRAKASIGQINTKQTEKILPSSPASIASDHTSSVDMPFKESFAIIESLDSNLKTRAPDGALETARTRTSQIEPPADLKTEKHGPPREARSHISPPLFADRVELTRLVELLKRELEPALRLGAAQAAAREHDKTRHWFEDRALPKAVRVAQHESYSLLKQHGLLKHGQLDTKTRAAAELSAGRRGVHLSRAKPLSPAEIEELADLCATYQQFRGQPVEVTLAELSADVGGCILAEDAPRVHGLAIEKLQAMSKEATCHGN